MQLAAPTPKRMLALMLLIGALLAGAFSVQAATAPDALAANRPIVCSDVYVRSSPGGGAFGILYFGQTFNDSGSRSGGYAYGFAYGNVNANGWVLASCLG